MIKKTKDYTLSVGQSVESGNPCYQITNNTHGVIEIESYILPQALKYIDDLQETLDGPNTNKIPKTQLN
jgi:hypothetical protein